MKVIATRGLMFGCAGVIALSGEAYAQSNETSPQRDSRSKAFLPLAQRSQLDVRSDAKSSRRLYLRSLRFSR